MSFVTDANGFRTYTKGAGDRSIYVNSLVGNDGTAVNNDPTHPYRTISAAWGQMRDGTGDQLLLARNSDFSSELFPFLNKSGRSADEPFLIGCYTHAGDADTDPRPILGNPVGNPDDSVLYCATSLNYFVLQSITLKARASDTGYGLDFWCSGTDLYVEDCIIRDFYYGCNCNCNVGENKVFRRATFNWCVWYRNRQISANHNEGMYFSALRETFTLTNCAFIENGSGDTLSHNAYIDDVRASGSPTLVTVEGCWFLGDTPCSHGLQCRPGGTIHNNVFWKCAMSCQTGSGGIDTGGTDMDPLIPPVANTTQNLFYQNRDIVSSTNNPRGDALHARWSYSGTLSDNLFVDGSGGSDPYAIVLENDNGTTANRGGNKNLVIEDNVIFNWGAALWVQGVSPKTANNIFRRNRICLLSGNKTIITYLNGIGGQLISSNNQFFSAGFASNTTGNFDALSFDTWRTAVGDTSSVYSQPTFSNQNATPLTYFQSIGVAGLTTVAQAYAHVSATLLARQRSTTNPAYSTLALNNYMRVAFSMTPIGTVTNPPVANAGPDQPSIVDTDRSGSESVTLDASASSFTAPATAIATYNWFEGPTLISSGSASGPSVTLSLGIHVLTLSVTDDTGLTSATTDSVTITVTPTTCTGFSSGTPSQTSAALSCTAYPTITTYTWQWGLTTSYGSSATTASPTHTPTGLTPSTLYHWRVRPNGPGVSGAYSADQTFTTDAPVNNAPIANAGPDQTATDTDRSGDHTVLLDGTGSSDPNGDALTYSWSLGGTVLSTSSTPTLTLPIGTSTILLTVTDPGTLTGTGSVTVTINPTTVTGLVATAVTTASAILTCSAYPTITSYFWQYGTTSLTSSATTSTPSLPLSGLTPGTQYRFNCTPYFGALAGPVSPLAFFTTQSNTFNSAPTANAGPAQTLTDTDFDGIVSLTLDGSASSDIDGTIVAYLWDLRDIDETIHLQLTGSAPTTLLVIGHFYAYLTVTDNDGASNPIASRVSIDVLPGTPTNSAIASTHSILLQQSSYPEMGGTYDFALSATSGSYPNWISNSYPSHTFAGLLPSTTYYYRTRVTSGNGVSSEWTTEASIDTADEVIITGPTAVIDGPTTQSADVHNGYTVPINFTATDSISGTNPINRYVWYVDSVLVQDSASDTLTYSFLYGYRTITLFVYDTGGLSDQTTSLLNVINPAPPPYPVPVISGTLTLEADHTTHLATFSLDALSSSPSVVDRTFLWHLNGAIVSASTTCSPSLPAGSHTISVTMSDWAGQSNSTSATLIVTDSSLSDPTITPISFRPPTLYNSLPISFGIVEQVKRVRNVFKP